MAHRVGIISIGDMGAGIARLLVANSYRVATNVSDRSAATQTRAKNAGVELLASDEELVSKSNYILSIVPPGDAKATADRIIKAHKADRESPLYYLDLNAIAPSTSRSIAESLKRASSEIRFIDGGIIGAPPSIQKDEQGRESWKVPTICLSGPHRLDEADHKLAELLNTKHVSPDIGTASGLKCCFASLTKGFTALAIQSFSTASQLGVLPQLEEYITGFSGQARLIQAQKSIVGMPHKAGRWVEEMNEIGKTFREDGGWDNGSGGESIFDNVAQVYKFVAEGTVLGQEHVDKRVRGTTARDAVDALGEGLEARRKRRQSI